MITIRQVRVDDWRLVKQIRLQALSEAPHAFVETLEDATSMSDEEWLDRTRMNAEGESSTCWLALVDDRLVGIAAGLRDLKAESPPALVSMWVAPDVRGQGLGRLLVEAVACWVRHSGASEMLAEITPENMKAAEFYFRLGFRHTPATSFAETSNVVLSLPLRSRRQANKNRRLVRQFVSAINEQNWSRLEELVDPAFVRHSYAARGSEIWDRNDLLRFLKSELETFPDGRETILDLIADGDRVAARQRFTGTQKGRMGSFPASNKRLTAEYIAIYRLESSRIVEAWAEWDNLSSLMQLGHYRPEDL